MTARNDNKVEGIPEYKIPLQVVTALGRFETTCYAVVVIPHSNEMSLMKWKISQCFDNTIVVINAKHEFHDYFLTKYLGECSEAVLKETSEKFNQFGELLELSIIGMLDPIKSR